MRNPCLGRDVTFRHASKESTSCVAALQTEQVNVSMNCVAKLNGNIISSRKYLKRCLSVCLISVLQCSIKFLVPLSVSWLHNLKSAVFSVLSEDHSRSKSSTAHVNTFPMIRWVLRNMRDDDWTLLPNDIEPGFCFIRHSETRDIGDLNEQNPLFCLRSGVMVLQQFVRSSYCAKQRKTLEKRHSGVFTLEYGMTDTLSSCKN